MKKLAIMVVGIVLALVGSADAALIQVDLTDGTAYSGTNAPFSGGSYWNKLGGGIDDGDVLLDDGVTVATGVSVASDFNTGGGTKAENIAGAASPLDTYQKTGTSVTISGLAPGTYTVYAMGNTILSHGTNSGHINTFLFDLNGGSNITSLTHFEGGSPVLNTTAWEEGNNYGKGNVTLSAGQDLVITMTNQTYGGSPNNLNPWGGFQIVPEPGTMALLALGGGGVLLRRRRS